MRIILGLIFFFNIFCAMASIAVDARSRLITMLQHKGFHLGYNDETGDFVVIAGSSNVLYGKDKAPSLLWKSHKIAFQQAYAKACREINNIFWGDVTGSNKVRLWRNARKWLKMNKTEMQVESLAIVRGLEILAMETDVLNDRYYVNIAVSLNLHWISKQLESGESICPASGWEKEFYQYIKNKKIEEIPSLGYFRDSNGFYHAYGAEAEEISSFSPVQKSAAIKMMELGAKANLSRLIEGVGVSGQKIESIMIRGLDKKISKNKSGYFSSSAQGVNVTSCRIFDGLLYSSLINREVYIIVHSAVNSEKDVTNVKKKECQHVSEDESAVKVFNPSTGKFE